MTTEEAVGINLYLSIGSQRADTDLDVAVLPRFNDGAKLVLRGQQHRVTHGGISLYTALEFVVFLVAVATCVRQNTQRVQAHLTQWIRQIH